MAPPLLPTPPWRPATLVIYDPLPEMSTRSCRCFGVRALCTVEATHSTKEIHHHTDSCAGRPVHPSADLVGITNGWLRDLPKIASAVEFRCITHWRSSTVSGTDPGIGSTVSLATSPTHPSAIPDCGAAPGTTSNITGSAYIRRSPNAAR